MTLFMRAFVYLKGIYDLNLSSLQFFFLPFLVKPTYHQRAGKDENL